MHDPSRFVVAFVLVALALSGCADHRPRARARPSLLIDGTRAATLPEVLASLGEGAVMSRVRVVRPALLGARGRACVGSFRREFGTSAGTVVVERTGMLGTSLTFVDPGRRVVLGCDRTRRQSGWCGRSVGRLFDGTLRDARLDILCAGSDRRPLGFAWLVPRRRTRWIVVARPSGAEVEEIAAGLPVRIATRDVDRAASSATFAVVEYDSAGSEVARYLLRARIAG